LFSVAHAEKSSRKKTFWEKYKRKSGLNFLCLFNLIGEQYNQFNQLSIPEKQETHHEDPCRS